MKSFILNILSADEPMFQGECASLEFSTTDGRYGIYADHSNMVMAVIPGIINIKKPDGDMEYLSVDDGIIVIEHGKVTMLIDSAERPDEIDANAARREYEEALMTAHHSKSLKEYDAAMAKIARELLRMKLTGYNPKM